MQARQGEWEYNSALDIKRGKERENVRARASAMVGAREGEQEGGRGGEGGGGERETTHMREHFGDVLWVVLCVCVQLGSADEA